MYAILIALYRSAKNIQRSIACEVCHLLKKAQHSNGKEKERERKGEKKKENKKNPVVLDFYDIAIFTLGNNAHKDF